MSEEQETTTAEATVEPAETQENQAPSEVGESKEAQPQQVSEYNVPEGFEINDSMKTELDGLFKDSNINPETAQKIVDKHFEILGERRSSYDDHIENQRQEWASEAMSDKEFGGASLSENMLGARKAMNSFSQPAVSKDGKAVLHQEGPMKGQQMSEVEALMNESGWGNHPAMIRVFHRVNQAMSEDSFVQGDMKPMEKKKTHADIMYGGTHPS
tara:strand:+ start:280 stop:921 length:642 start_codon:yes stop_codon:yes gene_type:complete